jgi:hypothetical protein
MVADVRDVLFAAGHLPDLAPHLLDLELVERAGKVALDGNGVDSEVDGRHQAKSVRHVAALPVQDVLDTRAGRAVEVLGHCR